MIARMLGGDSATYNDEPFSLLGFSKSPCRVYDVLCYNNTAGDLWAMLFDYSSASALSNGQIPVARIKVLGGNQNNFSYAGGRPMRFGAQVAWSSTGDTLTQVATAGYFDAVWL